MMITAFLAFVQASAQPSSEPPPAVEPPVQMTVQGVGVERTIAKFMDVCFRPRWNVTKVRAALKDWDGAYVEKPTTNPNAFAWDSTHSRLTLTTLPQASQCALSIGSNQARTGGQLLAMLRPAVEAELGRPVQENDGKFYLEWTDPDSGYVERIALALATDQPSQSIWYVFDKTAPGVRQKLESLIPPPKLPSE